MVCVGVATDAVLVPFGPSMVEVVTVFAAFTSAVPLTTGWVPVDAARGAMVPSAPVAAAAAIGRVAFRAGLHRLRLLPAPGQDEGNDGKSGEDATHEGLLSASCVAKAAPGSCYNSVHWQ